MEGITFGVGILSESKDQESEEKGLRMSPVIKYRKVRLEVFGKRDVSGSMGSDSS